MQDFTTLSPPFYALQTKRIIVVTPLMTCLMADQLSSPYAIEVTTATHLQ